VDREIAAAGGFLDGHRRVAGYVEAAMAAAGFRFASRQRDVDVADLVNLEAFADRFDAAEPFKELSQPVCRQAEDFEVDVFRLLAAHQSIADPTAHDERPSSCGTNGRRDLARAIEGAHRRLTIDDCRGQIAD